MFGYENEALTLRITLPRSSETISNPINLASRKGFFSDMTCIRHPYGTLSFAGMTMIVHRRVEITHLIT
jgi:hypothetical protein